MRAAVEKGRSASQQAPAAAFARQMVDGLVLVDRWQSPHEGGFTMLAKLLTVNVMSASDAATCIFGVRLSQGQAQRLHGRSLVDGVWMGRSPTRSPTLSTMVASGTLSTLAGPWTAHLASDRHLRYCTLCIDRGFQSALCQITGLRRCPAHGIELRERCPHCDHPTPRYALCEEAFECVMHCSVCGLPLSKAWDKGALARWTPLTDVAAYAPLERWLRRVAGLELQWPDLVHWMEDRSDPEAETRRRCAVFAALRHLVPLKLDEPIGEDPARTVGIRLTPVLVAPCSPPGLRLDEDLQGARQRIYRAIRRHYGRRWRVHRQLSTYDHDTEAFTSALPHGILATVRPGVPAALHAWLLWRHRFEPSEFLQWALRSGRRVPDLPIRRHLVTWPLMAHVDDATWAHFVIRCMREDVWTAEQWARLVRLDPLEAGQLSPAWMERVNLWCQRLSPNLQAWPCAVSQLIWHRPDGRRELVLLWWRRDGAADRPGDHHDGGDSFEQNDKLGSADEDLH